MHKVRTPTDQLENGVRGLLHGPETRIPGDPALLILNQWGRLAEAMRQLVVALDTKSGEAESVETILVHVEDQDAGFEVDLPGVGPPQDLGDLARIVEVRMHDDARTFIEHQ